MSMTSFSQGFEYVYPFGEEIIRCNEHPKFRKGDIITNGKGISIVKGFNRSELGLCYVISNSNCNGFAWLCEQVDSIFHRKTDNYIDYKKKYEEALEVTKRELDFLKEHNVIGEETYSKFVKAFPELKESEDVVWLEKQVERRPVISDDALREGISHFGITQYQIDNWLKKYVDVEKQGEQPVPSREMILNVWELGNHWKDLTNGCISTEYGTQLDYILTHWYEGEHIEKQGEQKSDKVKPKFKVGDWITNGHCKCQITFIDSRYWYSKTCVLGNVIDIDKTFHLWTIQDAKDGGVLNSPSHRLIWIYKDNEHYHACVNMNYVTENVATDGLISIPNDACPATKDEQTILFARMKESGYEWDAEKKELKLLITNGGDFFESENCDQKPVWSKEDEKMFDEVINNLHNYIFKSDDTYSYIDCDKHITWLKSLKERMKGE